MIATSHNTVHVALHRSNIQVTPVYRELLCFCTGSYAAAATATAVGSYSRDNFWITFEISLMFDMIVGPDL